MSSERSTGNNTGKVIAITFDDGPNITVTPRILDVAEKHGVKFSFFVVGDQISEQSGAVMKRAYDLGCEIGNHSLTHSVMTQMSADAIKAEIAETNARVRKWIGEEPKFFRPPYISLNHTLYESVDMPFICGCGCNDWDNTVSVDRRVQFVTEECGDGCIVLLHDSKDNHATAEAVEKIVPLLLGQGYNLVTVSELFAAKGVSPRADIEKIYSHAAD